MLRKKPSIIWLFIPAPALLLFWFVGWTSVSKNHFSDTGKRIRFTDPMVKVYLVNDTYGEADSVSKQVIFNKKWFDKIGFNFHDPYVTDVDPCESFTVVYKYSIKRHGFLVSAFKEYREGNGFISLLSDDGDKYVILESTYERFKTLAENKTDVRDSVCSHN